MEKAETEIEVGIVFALPDRQLSTTLKLPCGVTAGVAIERCGFQAEFPGVDFANAPIGIHGRRISRETVLQQGDRVEIYRVLRADPKEVRRRRSRD